MLSRQSEKYRKTIPIALSERNQFKFLEPKVNVEVQLVAPAIAVTVAVAIATCCRLSRDLPLYIFRLISLSPKQTGWK